MCALTASAALGRTMDEGSGLVRRLLRQTWHQIKSPLYRNAILIILASVLSQGLGFFFWLVVARHYAPTDVGLAITIFQTLTFLATLAPLGLGIGIIRFLPETANKPALVNTAATTCAGIALIFAIVFLSLVRCVAPDLAFVLDTPVYPVAVLITTVALALPSIYDQASYAMRRADVLTLRVLVMSIAKIPLAIGFSLTALTHSHIGVFLALALSLILSVFVEMFQLLPRVIPGFKPRLGFDSSQIRPMLRFSLGNHTANCIGAAGALLLPILILSVLGSTGAEDVAYFYVATVVAALLNVIPNAIFTSFYAEASQRNANRSADEQRAILFSVSLLIPGIAVLWLFSGEVLTWFGDPAYAEGAVDALRILVLGSIPQFVNGILKTRLRIRKRSSPLTIGAAITTAVTLGFGSILLQTHGINGLAAVVVLGRVAATPYYYAVAHKPFRRVKGSSADPKEE